MRIRMLTKACGPMGNREAGQEYEVSLEEGAALCGGHYAVPVPEAAIERAVSLPEAAEVRDNPRDGARKRRGR